MMKVTKNNRTFTISNDTYSKSWFSNHITKWEPNTFHILEHYKNIRNGLYIDIGSWIGPTVLYSANIYNKVIAIEPDPVAVNRLKQNLESNYFDNITLIEKGLSDKDGKTKFGGNGDFGNSESTLLINNKKHYLSYKGRHTTVHKHNDITEIETLTMETLMNEQKINPELISLIKMDIEGGEIILIPALQTFLKKHKPVFYISLHYCFLRDEDIQKILNILFKIYDNCYYFNKNGWKKPVDKKIIKAKKIDSLVFE